MEYLSFSYKREKYKMSYMGRLFCNTFEDESSSSAGIHQVQGHICFRALVKLVGGD